MIYGVITAIVGYLFWILFVKGMLWKMIVGIFGWLGMYGFMTVYVEGAENCLITISNYNFSWAEVIPTIIVLLALISIKGK